MRKTTSRIAKLPEPVRTEINRKLQECWTYRMIREWLFAQKAERDVPALEVKAGEFYAAAWERTAKSADNAGDACEQALSNWYCKYYPAWVEEQKAKGDESVRMVERLEQVSRLAGQKAQPGAELGGNLLIRSLLLEAIGNARNGGSDPEDIARLAHAWARMSQAGVEVEKLKLQSQEAVEIALQAMYDEIKDSPEAVAAFHTFYDVVKGLKKGNGEAGGSPATTGRHQT